MMKKLILILCFLLPSTLGTANENLEAAVEAEKSGVLKMVNIEGRYSIMRAKGNTCIWYVRSDGTRIKMRIKDGEKVKIHNDDTYTYDCEY